MARGPLVIAIVLVAVTAPVGVGAVAPETTSQAAPTVPSTPTEGNASAAPALGQAISAMMQASVAQTAVTVENGMWAAAYANASNASEKRALVHRRTAEVEGALEMLRAERRTLRAAYRNGTINRTTYLARLSTIVGRLAAISEGVEAAEQRGTSIGVNRSRLQELRSLVRSLSGPDVSRLVRNLIGGSGPGTSGLFERSPPEGVAERGPGNESGQPPGHDRGRDNEANATNTTTDGDPGQPGSTGNASAGSSKVNRSDSAGNSSNGRDRGERRTGPPGVITRDQPTQSSRADHPGRANRLGAEIDLAATGFLTGP